MTSRKTARGGNPARQDTAPSWRNENETNMAHDRAETKTYQLARQVEEALSCALACSRSAALRDLYLVAAVPIRGAALMRVEVAVEGEDYEYEEIVEALERATGYLRGEVARAIHRKRAPSFQFIVVPMHSVALDEVRNE